ncbi:hypothetical protein B0H14DRAFT_2607731 [Mycena olivaceomarginata]|nr:hypothetical protein B0H14DRAFT_2607731 [Mycena olivaceomarginata]
MWIMDGVREEGPHGCKPKPVERGISARELPNRSASKFANSHLVYLNQGYRPHSFHGSGFGAKLERFQTFALEHKRYTLDTRVHAPRSGAKQRVLSPSDLLAANLGLLTGGLNIRTRDREYGVWRGRQLAAGLTLATKPLAEHKGFQPASS